MAFKKGQSGNSNGRPKGAENKEKKELRERINKILEDSGDKLNKELEKLEGKDYVDALTKLMEYSIPKLNRVEMKGDIKNTIREIIVEKIKPKE